MRRFDISIKYLIVAVLLMVGVINIASVVFMSELFQGSALDSKEESLNRIIEASTKEILEDLTVNSAIVGGSLVKGKEFTGAIKKQNINLLSSLLQDTYKQRIVTTGVIKLDGLRVYDAKLNLITDYVENDIKLDVLEKRYKDQVTSREGADRFKQISFLWHAGSKPVYSTLYPIGTFKLNGYIEVVSDPVYSLSILSKELQSGIQIFSANNVKNALFVSDNWSESGDFMQVSYMVKGSDQIPLMDVLLQENIASMLGVMNQTKWQVIAFTLLMVVLTTLLSMLVLNKQFFDPLKTALSELTNVSSGQLRVSTQQSGLKEIRHLSTKIDEVAQSLRHTILDIQNCTDQMDQAVGSLESITDESSNAASDQQSVSQSLNESIDQMSSSMSEVRHDSESALSAVQSIVTNTETSTKVIQSSVGALSDLSDAFQVSANSVTELMQMGQDITSLLDVIKSIAEQTNLLALNAAIEAARAGEMGRGFAVVADEVRRLAGNTQASAIDIEEKISKFNGLIEQVVTSMEQGNEQAEISSEQAVLATQSIQEIQTAIQEISNSNQKIVSSVGQQSVVATRVSEQVESISSGSDKVQQVSSQAASETRSLATQAAELKGLVSKFKV